MDQLFDTVILQIPIEDVPLAEVLHFLFDLIVRFANRRVEQWGVTLVWTFAHAGLKDFFLSFKTQGQIAEI